MSRHGSLAFALIFIASLATAPVCSANTSPLIAQGTLEPAFAPWDDIENLIVDAIADSHTQILVQAYLLTSKKISAALIAAHRHGVDVQVLVDAGQLERVESSAAPLLATAGIPVWLETHYENAHNKIIVIDSETPRATVITGSFNFTWTAQHKNAENVLIARNNPALAARYAQNWQRHRLDATTYKR